jgi:hypothetical protein
MTNPTTKLVTQTRLRNLLECYGSSPSSWPEEERQAALNLLKGLPELKTLRDQIRSLDDILAQYHEQGINAIDPLTTQSLQQRIMSQLPEQELPDSGDNDHTNKSEGSTRHPYRSRIWVGSIAASLFIVSLSVGVIDQLVSKGGSPTNQQSSNVVSNGLNNGLNNEFAQWAWEDITGESLTLEVEREPTTLLALVEMEFPAE